MNPINWTLKAAGQLRKLDRQHQRTVVDAVGDLAAMPQCRNAGLSEREGPDEARLRLQASGLATTGFCSIGTAASRSSKFRK
ncbi:hypothetical protein [Cupriavidus basilensis]|uniref:hypothetical protein n=1 Tax=Cupriavidus basilensis TaxID=68895 RepID=UPI003F5BC461